jgi:alkaline phosphatase
MSLKALDILNRASKERSTKFFIMIEGSRIDMAGHSNDPATHLRDILEYNSAIDAVKQFVNSNPGTVMVSVSGTLAD